MHEHDFFTLRPHQREALEGLRNARSSGARSALGHLATGTGKTVVLVAAAKETIGRGGRVLVVVPTGEIADQVVRTAAGFGLAAELERREQRATSEARLVVASVQSIARQSRLARFDRRHFDLVVFDECHHVVASSWLRVREHFEHAFVLGLTATPDRGDGTALAKVFDVVAYRLDIREAIARELLVPLRMWRVVIEGFDVAGVRSTAGDLDASQLADVMDGQVLEEMAAVLAKRLEGRPTVAFVPTVRTAHELARILRHLGMRAEAVDGAVSADERSAILGRYRDGGTQVLVNVAILTEGWDAPHTSCIVIGRPTRSRALFTQMVGRGLRLHPGKLDALVLDFTPMAAKHSLVSPVDLLGGEDLDPKVKAAADAIAADAQMDLDIGETIERARTVVRDAEEAARVRHVLMAIDPFAMKILGVDVDPTDATGEPATHAQLARLRQIGAKVKGPVSRRLASKLISAAADRRERGLCTPKQAAFLEQRGLNANVPFDAANEAIEACKLAMWRTPGWLLRDPRFAPANDNSNGEAVA
jgi:superfamily II DNA or RNA helicase